MLDRWDSKRIAEYLGVTRRRARAMLAAGRFKGAHKEFSGVWTAPVRSVKACTALRTGPQEHPPIGEFGTALNRARLDAGLSATALAKAVGVSLPSIRQYELGVCRPRPDVLKRIENVLGCTLHE